MFLQHNPRITFEKLDPKTSILDSIGKIRSYSQGVKYEINE